MDFGDRIESALLAGHSKKQVKQACEIVERKHFRWQNPRKMIVLYSGIVRIVNEDDDGGYVCNCGLRSRGRCLHAVVPILSPYEDTGYREPFIVDDTEITRRFLSDMMERDGWQCLGQSCSCITKIASTLERHGILYYDGARRSLASNQIEVVVKRTGLWNRKRFTELWCKSEDLESVMTVIAMEDLDFRS